MLSREVSPAPPVLTPFHLATGLSNRVGYPIYLKREDLFPYFGGGSKGRKMAAFARTVAPPAGTWVVAAGSTTSNHVRSVLAWASELDLPSSAILHNAGGPQKWTAHEFQEICSRADRVTIVAPDQLGGALEEELNRAGRCNPPCLVAAGGHHREGVEAYIEVTRELLDQADEQDVTVGVVALATGTGGTQAGMVAGSAGMAPGGRPRVVGICVGRDSLRTTAGIVEALGWLGGDDRADLLEVIDDYLFGGYGLDHPELEEVCRVVRRLTGLTCSPTYMGRLFAPFVLGDPRVKPAPGSAAVVIVSGR